MGRSDRDADVATKGASRYVVVVHSVRSSDMDGKCRVQPSIDMTVGERERGTLESL